MKKYLKQAKTGINKKVNDQLYEKSGKGEKMKRIAALTTMTCLLLSTGMIYAQTPGNAAAVSPQPPAIDASQVDSQASASQGKEVSGEKLTGIIGDIKKRFVIDDKGASFRYSVNYESGINMYNFSWESQETSTYMKYGEDGNVYWYYRYAKESAQPSYQVKIKSLPEYDRSEAKVIAENFLLKALPKQSRDFRIKQGTGNLSSDMYSFEFEYFRNSIPAEGISATVMVNSITGDISNFSTSLNNSISYESYEGALTPQSAEKAYRSELGVKLVYQSEYDYEKNVFKRTKLLYVPAYGNEYVIDAKTGKRINLYRDFYNMQYAGRGEGEAAKDSAPVVQLTEQEIAEIQAKTKLSSLSQAKAKIAGYRLESLEKDMAVTSAQLYESKMNTKSGYIWSVNYASPDDRKSLSVQLDAGSLEIIGFSSYGYGYIESQISQAQIDSARVKAAEALKLYSSTSQGSLKLDEVYLNEQLGSRSQYVSVRYVREENAVEFPENYIHIVYDTASQKITSYYMNWYDIELPKPEKTVSPDMIYDKIFKENKIELKYRIIYASSSKIDGKLIYEINQDDYMKPLVFDALTGERIVTVNDADTAIEEYRDISQSRYQDEVKTLMLLGIGFKGGELKPSAAIRHDEFLYLIAQTFEYAPVPLYSMDRLSDSQIAGIEQQLVSRGVIDKDEKLQSRIISHQETVKYLIRALGYEKLAVHTEIFKLNLADAEKVTEKFYGYVAIGDALDIIVKDAQNRFLPSSNTTRDQALKMIFNYLR